MRKALSAMPFGGPTAAFIDVLLLLLVYMMTILVTRPDPPTHVIIAEHEVGDAAAVGEAPLAIVWLDPDGIRIGSDGAPQSLEAARDRLAGLAEDDGKVLVCIRGIPFEEHWALRSMLAETLHREPYFIPCKEDPR